MKTAGLTGGIATGKSTVAGFFRELGAEIVCADEAARAAVRRGTPAWEEIVTVFGREALGPDDELDREEMGRRVFSDPVLRHRLEGIVHPRVFSWMEERISEVEQRNPDAVVIQDVPLLFESGMEARLRPVLVVYAPESVQLKRLMERDGRSKADAKTRIDAQMSIEEKRRRADRVIDNGGSPEETRRQAAEIFEWLRDRDKSRSEGNST